MLSIGRVVFRRQRTKMTSATARWAEYLNRIAAMALVIFWALQSIVTDNPNLPVPGLFLRLTFTTHLLFWTTLYPVKMSFLLLYRSPFAISETFCLIWWCVLAFTLTAFFVDVFSLLWIRGSSYTLFIEGLSTTSAFAGSNY